MRIVHLALTPVAGSPWNITQATNAYTNITARLITYDPESYGGRTFQNDLDWRVDKKNALAVLKEADIVHLHQWFRPIDWFGAEVAKICESKILVRQFHSAPELFTGGDDLIMEAIDKDPIPQLVMAQYQERFYPRARIVPNIIPINSRNYLPVKVRPKNTPPVVAWSPSSRNSLFSSRWETKGYCETLNILRRLEDKGVCRLDLIENLPHEESLNRKKMADLVFDEVVTGSCHTSGLEGLSLGKPVMGWLDERTQQVLRHITGANSLPWINVHLEDVEKTLHVLLKDKKTLNELGAESRVWMCEWYDDRILIKQYAQVYEDLIKRPEIFTKKIQNNLADHWRKIYLPNMIWESKRDRLALSLSQNSLKAIEKKKQQTNSRSFKNALCEVALSFLKPGDRVLDLSLNAVFKEYLAEQKIATPRIICETFRGSKKSGSTSQTQTIDFKKSLLKFPNHSFEVITLFLGDLKTMPLSTSLLKGISNLLVPGGRFIFTLNNPLVMGNKIEIVVPANFIPECLYGATSEGMALMKWDDRFGNSVLPQSKIDLKDLLVKSDHSLVAIFMKSPLVDDCPYQERVFPNILSSGHPSIDHVKNFQNPWLVYAMQNVSYRLKNPNALRYLADKVLETFPLGSNDRAAAICVKGYSLLNERLKNSRDNNQILSDIQDVIDLPIDNLMALRWRVSLQFLAGKINQALGHLTEAKKNYIACFGNDINEFGIHLATKTTEAIFLAGKLAYQEGKLNESQKLWKLGVSYGEKLLQINLKDILINQDHPNRFNYGDGVREYTLAWDNLAKCANGINLLQSGVGVNSSNLDSSFRFENEVLNKDLLENRQELATRSKLLEQTTTELDLANAELKTRTQELVHNRQELATRSNLLEQTTTELDLANKELDTRTQELVHNRQELATRSNLLEQTTTELDLANAELNSIKNQLAKINNSNFYKKITLIKNLLNYPNK
jgi:SAM-dependent methyltransferase